MNIKKSLSLVSTFVIALSVTACGDHSVDVETFLPEPEWLDTVKAPAVNSAAEVRNLWRSKDRCCINKRKLRDNQREFYKACYVAVANNRNDELLVAKCLQLMDNGMEKAVRRKIYRHYIDNYFYLKSPTDNCVNCLPADPIANVVRRYAWAVYADDVNKAVGITQRVIDERLDEISPYVQMALYSQLARFYRGIDYSEDQLNSLRDARDRLRPLAGNGGAFTYNFKELNKNISQLVEG